MSFRTSQGGPASLSGDTPTSPPQEGGYDLSGKAVGVRMMGDLQRDFGLTPEAAAGVVGSLSHESGDFNTLQEISPTVKGSRGGWGYAQWTGPRRVSFDDFADASGLDPSGYQANYGFLRNELENTSEGRVLNSLQGVTDVKQAADIFTKEFLRPGVKAMGSRYTRAAEYAGIDPSELGDVSQAGDIGATRPKARPGIPEDGTGPNAMRAKRAQAIIDGVQQLTGGGDTGQTVMPPDTGMGGFEPLKPIENTAIPE